MNQTPLFDPQFLNIEYFFNLIFRFFQTIFNGAYNLDAVQEYLPALKIFLSLLSMFFIAGIAYVLVRIFEIRHAEHIKYHTSHVEKEEEGGGMGIARERFDKIVSKSNSLNSSDWKLAIIEADTIIDEMVEKMGYYGENLGERLRVIESSDFLTLQDAWEAHKVRNQIAHDGDAFVLTDRETRRVIALYEKVFKEFKYI